jgi:KDO2-lipid IV(A) lauroyltransferase
MWLYLAIQLGAAGSRVLPLSWRYRISTVIADFLWLIWTSKRRTCIDNMAVVLGGNPSNRMVRRIARYSFHQFGKGIVDFLGFADIDPQDPLIADMPVDGFEHITEGLKRGKGVIIATGHFGSIDLGGVALAKRVPKFYAVADTFQPPYVDRLVRKKRESKGFNLMPTTSARDLIRALHDNAVVVVLFDRPMPLDRGTQVSLFGQMTAVPSGPAVIGLRTGSAIVPAYIFRQKDNTIHALICPSVTDGLTGDKAWDERTIMQRLAGSLELAVRRAPAQWYMFRQMWPTAPAPDTAREMQEASIEAH